MWGQVMCIVSKQVKGRHSVSVGTLCAKYKKVNSVWVNTNGFTFIGSWGDYNYWIDLV